ncbi:MAG: hypothetical protein HY646_01765, partial [Acidobacteria bacterium]|nr:hypothetical protein [Acidobacteriota bacterium]
MPVKELILVYDAFSIGKKVCGQRPAGGEIIQVTLGDTARARLATRFAEMLPDDERRTPGISELLFVSVLVGLFVATECQFLRANVFRPVVGQFL